MEGNMIHEVQCVSFQKTRCGLIAGHGGAHVGEQAAELHSDRYTGSESKRWAELGRGDRERILSDAGFDRNERRQLRETEWDEIVPCEQRAIAAVNWEIEDIEDGGRA